MLNNSYLCLFVILGCFLYANFLENFKNDKKEAVNVYKSTCDTYNHAKACSQLGQCYLNGVGTEANLPTALHFYLKSCLEAKGLPIEKAIACSNSGDIILHGGDKNIKRDEELAERVLDIACKSSLSRGCMLSAEHLISKKRWTQAIKYLDSACLLNEKPACEMLVQIYNGSVENTGIKPDPELEAKYKDKAAEIKLQMENEMRFSVYT